MALEGFLKRSGVDYTLMRNDLEIGLVRGLPNHEQSTGKAYIGFTPDANIQINDILVNPAKERVYIIDCKTAFFKGAPHQLKAFYHTEAEHCQSDSAASSVFNIQNAYGSVIGNNNSATINYNAAMQAIKEQVASCESADKEELEKIVVLLEMIINNQVPPTKGLFSKFRDVMERNSWITGSISSLFLSWLMSQIP